MERRMVTCGDSLKSIQSASELPCEGKVGNENAVSTKELSLNKIQQSRFFTLQDWELQCSQGMSDTLTS